MEEILDEIEQVEISAILDSNGQTVENFDKDLNKSNKSKKYKSEIHIKLNTILAAIITIIFIVAMLCAMTILIPTTLCIVLLTVVVNKVIKFFKK